MNFGEWRHQNSICWSDDDLAADRNGFLYLACDSGMFVSRDSAATWTRTRPTGVRRPGIFEFAINSRGYIFAASQDTGMIFFSKDTGKTLTPMHAPIPTTAHIADLFLTENDKLIVATSAHGIYELTDSKNSVRGNSLPSSVAIVSVTPNPARTSATIVVSCPAGERITAELYDSGARLVKSTTFIAHTGESSYVLDLADVIDGAYTLQLRATSSTAVAKMVIQH